MKFKVHKDNIPLNVMFTGAYLMLIFNIWSLLFGYGKPILFPFIELNIFSIIGLVGFQYMNSDVWIWGNDRIVMMGSDGLYEVCWISSGIDCKVVIQRVKFLNLLGGIVSVSLLSKVWATPIENTVRLSEVESFSPSNKYIWYEVTILNYEKGLEQAVPA